MQKNNKKELKFECSRKYWSSFQVFVSFNSNNNNNHIHITYGLYFKRIVDFYLDVVSCIFHFPFPHIYPSFADL